MPSHTSLAEEAVSPPADEDCLACHDTVNHEKFKESVHGGNGCVSCHTDIEGIPHQEKIKPVQCGECHTEEVEFYKVSTHGLATEEGKPAADCFDCHGDHHAIVATENPASHVNRDNLPQTCGTCHGDSHIVTNPDLLAKMPLKTYQQSIHGKKLAEGNKQVAVCTDCHGTHDLYPPYNPKSRLYHSSVPKTCGKCHEAVLEEYQKSIHGKAVQAGKLDAPVCTNCHGEHTIRAAGDKQSSVYGARLAAETCAQCHSAERIVTKYRLLSNVVETYLDSYHGLAGRFGVKSVANCSSCHGVHNILPASDPASSIYPQNLPQTCGKCHPGSGEQLVRSKIHVSLGSKENKLTYFLSLSYVWLIIIAIGAMLLHNTLDFRHKFKEHYEKNKAEGHPERFTKQQKVQHWFLMVSFMLLVYTGFALKYPGAWWAYPFVFFDFGFDWRGVIHRGAALVFSVLGVYHIGYLALTKQGRKEFAALCFEKKDWTDFLQLQKYNLSKAKEKPRFKRYSYIEKMEYWALVWGTFIMILTGAMLTFENLVMQYFPKWFLDVATVIHFYEAVLATLAILIWHFYFVILDPDHYPLNTSMSIRDERDEDDRSGDSI